MSWAQTPAARWRRRARGGITLYAERSGSRDKVPAGRLRCESHGHSHSACFLPPFLSAVHTGTWLCLRVGANVEGRGDTGLPGPCRPEQAFERTLTTRGSWGVGQHAYPGPLTRRTSFPIEGPRKGCI